jgi:hypothetical protein
VATESDASKRFVVVDGCDWPVLHIQVTAKLGHVTKMLTLRAEEYAKYVFCVERLARLRDNAANRLSQGDLPESGRSTNGVATSTGRAHLTGASGGFWVLEKSSSVDGC